MCAAPTNCDRNPTVFSLRGEGALYSNTACTAHELGGRSALQVPPRCLAYLGEFLSTQPGIPAHANSKPTLLALNKLDFGAVHAARKTKSNAAVRGAKVRASQQICESGSAALGCSCCAFDLHQSGTVGVMHVTQASTRQSWHLSLRSMFVTQNGPISHRDRLEEEEYMANILLMRNATQGWCLIF